MDSAVAYSLDMARPSKSSLSQESEYSGDPCAPEYFCVRYFVLPCDAKHPVEAAEVEAVKSVLLTCICCPCFTAVKKGACILLQLTIF